MSSNNFFLMEYISLTLMVYIIIRKYVLTFSGGVRWWWGEVKGVG